MSKEDEFTHFGFDKVRIAKSRKSCRVFNSVSADYDIMNDLMSLGTHRILKRIAVNQTKLKAGERVLDLAGGNRMTWHCFCTRFVSSSGFVFVCDINQNMLKKGREKLLDKGIIKGIRICPSRWRKT